MYKLKQIEKAIKTYNELGHYQKTIDKLGYPTVGVLWQWVHGNVPKTAVSEQVISNKVKSKTLKKSHKWSKFELGKRIKAVRLADRGFSLSYISKVCNDASFTTIQRWISDYKKGKLMENIPKVPVEGDGPVFEGVTDPQETIRLLKLENDIYRGLVDILKVNSLKEQSNQVKTKLIDYLRQEKSIQLKELTDFLKISKSSYSYQHKILNQPDKYAKAREEIKKIFFNHNCSRGYRLITYELRQLEEPIVLSEKVVLRLMKEENLYVIYNKKKRNYNSYDGEISKAPMNLVNRNFHADAPNKVWLTDITQFNLGSYKVYLSPIIDCYEGSIVSYSISRKPNAKLVNSSLKKAIKTLNKDEHPICHSDRGAHYRWPEWINLCNSNGIVRSMSKKACSPDNAACEGFFGRLKNEFFYYRDWKNISYKEFKSQLNKYIWYYNNKRLKENLGWKSPKEYRDNFLKIA